MPKIRTSKTKVPEGFEVVEAVLNELTRKMRDGGGGGCGC